MKHLIEIIEDEARVSHRVVAQETGNKAESIQALITKNIKDFEDFGHLRFKIGTVQNSVGAKNKTKTYYLNEQQATFLMTLLRNSTIVVTFKKLLVKAFYSLKEEQTPSIENKTKVIEHKTARDKTLLSICESEKELLQLNYQELLAKYTVALRKGNNYMQSNISTKKVSKILDDVSNHVYKEVDNAITQAHVQISKYLEGINPVTL